MRFVPLVIGLVAILGSVVALITSRRDSQSENTDATAIDLHIKPTVDVIQGRLTSRKPLILSVQQRSKLLLAARPSRLSLGEICHALPLYGTDLELDLGSERQELALDVLLDSELSTSLIGNALLRKTDHGARVRKNVFYYVDGNDDASEPHYGQLISALALEGLQLDTQITYADGSHGALRDLIAELRYSFSKQGEVFWDAVGLSIYSKPNETAWYDKFGEAHSYDDLLSELLSRRDDESSCCGTHKPIAIAILLAVDETNHILSTSARQKGIEYLERLKIALLQSMDTEGFWLPDWYRHLGDESTQSPELKASVEGQMLATSHHLYWMLLLPDDLRPGDYVFLRAGRWLQAQLFINLASEEWWRENYCPATHSAYIVLQLSVDEDR